MNVVNNGGINIHDTITITGHGRGYIALNGQYESYPTAQLYTTPLNYNGSLSFLSNVVGIAVWNVYPDLSYNYKLYNLGHMSSKSVNFFTLLIYYFSLLFTFMEEIH